MSILFLPFPFGGTRLWEIAITFGVVAAIIDTEKILCKYSSIFKLSLRQVVVMWITVMLCLSLITVYNSSINKRPSAQLTHAEFETGEWLIQYSINDKDIKYNGLKITRITALIKDKDSQLYGQNARPHFSEFKHS
ncbi:MAG: hypothetical protein ABEI13_00215, partial [Candidatus Paceibacteria bacterium]